jgi:hypothetical protein
MFPSGNSFNLPLVINCGQIYGRTHRNMTNLMDECEIGRSHGGIDTDVASEP